MKSSKTLVSKWLAVPAILTSFAITAAAQAPREATVLAIGGTATYARGGGAFTALPVGAKLRDGDVVRTGAGSHVDIDLGKGVGGVQVAPNSTLAVERLTFSETGADRVTETQLDLKTGALYARINKLSKASRYEIKTPRGIAGVRGTTLLITSDGCLTVGEDSAAIAYANNGAVQTFVVEGGNTVCPGDTAPRPASSQVLADIVDAVRDLQTHGGLLPAMPQAPPIEPFISPTLPGD